MDVGVKIHGSGDIEIRTMTLSVEELDGFVVFHRKGPLIILDNCSHLGQPIIKTTKPALALAGWGVGDMLPASTSALQRIEAY